MNWKIPAGVQAVGISWYEEADYSAILRIMDDADRFPTTWAEWRKGADKAVAHLEGQGLRVFCAIIDPKGFPGWCAVRGHKVDGKARTAFANDYTASQMGWR